MESVARIIRQLADCFMPAEKYFGRPASALKTQTCSCRPCRVGAAAGLAGPLEERTSGCARSDGRLQPAIVAIGAGNFADQPFEWNEVAHHFPGQMTGSDAFSTGRWHVDVIAQHGVKLTDGRDQTPTGAKAARL